MSTNRIEIVEEKDEKFIYAKEGNEFVKIGKTSDLSSIKTWSNTSTFPQAGLWLVTHKEHSISTRFIAAQNDIIGSCLTMGRAYANHDAIRAVVADWLHDGSSVDGMVSNICSLLATGEAFQRTTKC